MEGHGRGGGGEGIYSFNKMVCSHPNANRLSPSSSAITLASLLSLGTPLLLGLSILVAQLFGAFLGSLLFRSILSNSAFLDAFSRLGVLRVLATAAEDGTAEEQLLVPTLVTNG